MIKEAFFRFLTGNTVPTELSTLRTTVMANAFLTIGVFTFSFFSYINLALFNSLFIGMLDGAAAVICLAALIDFRLHRNLERSVWIGAGNFFLFFLVFAYTNQNNDFGLIWTIFFPIFVITLMGHKQGLWVTSVFYLLLFVMAFLHIGEWDHGTWNLRAYLRFVVASTVLTYVVYVYESALHRSQIILTQTREKEERYLKELEKLSTTDPLTGLSNRRLMDKILEHHFIEAKHSFNPFTLILFDIDDFKRINDTYGHNTGDEVLVAIADLARLSLRKTDYIARWGGEEFLILLAQASVDDAVVLSEKIRQRIEKLQFPMKVTCSFGISGCDPSFNIYDLIDHADTALYDAKKSGKNKIVTFQG